MHTSKFHTLGINEVIFTYSFNTQQISAQINTKKFTAKIKKETLSPNDRQYSHGQGQ